MKTPFNTQGTVMVVSDSASEAALVKSLLDGDVDKVLVATSTAAAEIFQQSQASVLVLAYRNLQEASQVYLGLYRSSTKKQISIHPHRTIALCDRKDVKAAYDLCSNALVSDYVQFWPNSYDTHRLLMSVKRALQECADQTKTSQSATVLAQQARRLAELEALRAEYMQTDAGHAMAAGRRALAVAETGITKALEELSSHVASSRTPLEPVLPSRPTVLVVDDDEFESRLVGRILSSELYLPVYANNGAEALSMIGKARPALILMDIMMPEMSGLEAVQQLKADPELAKIPLIMMTGKREREVVLQCVKLGVSDFIGKPIDGKTLLDKIGRLVAPGITAGNPADALPIRV